MNFLLEGGNGWISIIGIVLILGVFYLTMLPQKKQEKKDAAMRASLAVGDEVTTIGGIIGKVIAVKGETFVLETTRQKTQIRFLKGAVRSIDVKVDDVAKAVAEEQTKAQEQNPEA